MDSRAMLGCTRCRFRGVREALATHIREEHGEEEEEEEAEVVEEEEDDDDDDGQMVRGGRVVDAIAEADVIHGRRSSSPLSFGVHYESEHLQLSDVSQAREVSPRMTQLIDVSQVRQESAAPRDVSQKTQPIEASPVRQAAGLFNPPAEITLPSPAARKGASRTHKEVIEILSSQDAGVEFIGESRSAPPPPPPPAQEVEAVAPGSVNPQLMELVYNRKSGGGGGGGPSSSRKVRFEEPHENSEGELPDVAAQPIAVESESVLEYSLPPKEQAIADSGKGKRLSKKPPVVVVVASSSSGNERAEKKRTKKKRARGSDNVEEEEDEDDERDDPAVDDEDVHEDDESFAPPLQTDSQLLGFEGSSTSVRKRRDAANSMLPPAVAGRSVAAQMAALAALATQNAGSADSPSSRGNSRRRKSVSPKEKSSDTKGQKRGRDNTEAAQEKASPQKKVTDAVAVTPSSSSKKTRSKQKKEDPQTPSSSSSAWKKKKSKKVQQDEEPTTSKAKSPSKAIAEAEKIAPPLSQEVAAAALPSTQEDGFLASPEDRPVLPRVKQQPVQGGEAVAGAALPKDQFQLSVPEPSQQGGLLYSQIAMGSQSQVPEYSQVPSYSLGNEIVYDLSVRGSPLKGSPVEEGEGEPSLSEEQVDAPASTATSPKTYADRVRVKPQAAPKKKREPVVAAQWRRGRVNGENLRFVEPPNAEKIFQGFQFIVTGCKVVNELDPPEKHVKFMVNLGDSKEKVQLYEWIHEAITKNGGKELWYPLPGVKGNPILDQKTRLASSMSRILDLPFPSNVICISEKPHRTIKWMMAVAANVPVVDWKWIHACIRYGKLIDYHDHLLELGYSTVKDALVEYRVREGGLPLVFETCKMELVGSAEWKALWALVLREQGAEVVERLSIGNETSLDYIVSEEDAQYPSASLEKKARDLRIPLVGKEWIIQCLLNAKLLKHSLRPEFTASRLDE